MDLPSMVGAGAIVAAVGLVVGGYLLSLGKTALEEGVKAAASEGARTAIQNANWMRELAHEIEKTRATARQELRFKSYGQLWSKLRPLALYDVESAPSFDQDSAGKLGAALTDWYFSADGGGLMLSATVREYYFALQDLLHGIARVGHWEATRPPEAESSRQLFERFLAILEDAGLGRAVSARQYFDKKDEDLLKEWPSSAAKERADGWRSDMCQLATRWTGLTPDDRFAAIQQVASVLRTTMTCDVESRMR